MSGLAQAASAPQAAGQINPCSRAFAEHCKTRERIWRYRSDRGHQPPLLRTGGAHMRLTIYSPEVAETQADFINFWSEQWTEKDKLKDRQFYQPYIGQPLSSEGLLNLFDWKNQTPLSAKKRARVMAFVSQLDDLQRLPKDTEADVFLKKFSHGGAIWRVFLLHCWSHAAGGTKYPIYDQHVHRAMTIIREDQCEEIVGWNDDQKIDAYLKRYVPFFRSFGSDKSQKLDQALMIFGRFMKGYRFPISPCEN
jgi:hypothetical protein